MPRQINEGLALAPTFTPHRRGVGANDTLANFVKAHGLDSQGYPEVVAEVKFGAGVTAATVNVNFWSDLTNSFLPSSPAMTFALTASAAIKFTSGGRRFFLSISAGTFGGGTVDIDVAGAAPHPEDND